MTQPSSTPPRTVAVQRAAQSLCPVCLRRVEARYEQRTLPDGEVEVCLCKRCPEHGEYTVPVWRGSGFAAWTRPKTPSAPPQPETALHRGCPYDCGLCPDHAQHTCTALVEVTSRCNLRCPLCFADAGTPRSGNSANSGNLGSLDGIPDEPSVAALHARFVTMNAHAGRCNVQISGGEPTMRADLPQIIAAARSCDFGLIQLNSNGLRLAEPGYARTLREAGLDSVYFQWDGLDDAVFQALRSRPLLAKKHAALAACAEAGLGVVLVMTLLAGVNAGQLGAMLRFAVETPGVRGLHIQPAAFFGRYPGSEAAKLAECPRITLPEVMAGLEAQSAGLVHRTDFHPPGCEHALCSFSAVYARTADGLTLLRGEEACSGPAPLPTAAEGARKAKAFVAGHWRGEESLCGGSAESGASARANGADFGRFMAGAGAAQRFTLSCMVFQDALSLDLERVRGCCIHVSTPDGRRVPFCLYNLTAVGGESLYRGR